MEAPLRPAIASLGIIPFKPAATLEAEKRERTLRVVPPPQYVSRLGSHIESCWMAAKEAKQNVERTMLKSLRQRNGIYEADKLQAIKQMGGSEVYVMLTSTKCRAAESWINDILRPAGDKPWTIDPTPVPDLPPELEEAIKQEVYEVAQTVLEQAQALSMEFADPDLVNELREYAKTRRDEMLEELREEGRVRVERMSNYIHDQMVQGGWERAFSEVVSDFVTMPAAILKGPVIRRRKVKKWVKNPQGKSVVKLIDDLVPEFDRVSPFDIYPAPDSRGPDDGYLIQRHRLSRTDLQALLGVPGYKDEAIRAALNDYGSGLVQNITIDSERERLEFAGRTGVYAKGDKIEALEFWGPVQGKLLIEWGLKEDIDPEIDYEINAWKVGQHVIRAILNPDVLGRKPYSVDSYERVAGSFWGKGIPELMADIQDVCNAVSRAIVNNSGLASGPQVEVDEDRCGKNEGIWPWKIWKSTNQQMAAGKAVNFYQPQIITEQLIRVFEFYTALSEDATGIPRWAYGNSDIGGAGQTSSGLSMLMTHASRGIKESIAHLDVMIGGAVERLYDYNMAYHPDEEAKGDCNIVAKASQSLVTKEHQLVRTNEFLDKTNNPTDLQILGIEGRGKVLRAAVKKLELGIDDIIPDDKGLRDMAAKLMEEKAMQMQMAAGAGEKGATPGAGPQTLDAAGNPAGGVDSNQFQNPEGQTPGMRMPA